MTVREKNALVAEKVLGLEVYRNKKGGWSLGKAEYYDDRGEYGLFNPLPDYFDSLEDAWKVVSYLASKGTQIRISNKAQSNDLWWCYLDGNDSKFNLLKGTAQGSTVAEAVCLAALGYSGVKI